MRSSYFQLERNFFVCTSYKCTNYMLFSRYFILPLLSVDVDSEKFDLSIKTVCEHRATLHEEMEPSLIADVLLEKLVLNIDEHDTVERAVTRKEKCIALLKLLVEKHKDDIQKFKCALRKCGCSSALDEMKEKESEMPGI